MKTSTSRPEYHAHGVESQSDSVGSQRAHAALLAILNGKHKV